MPLPEQTARAIDAFSKRRRDLILMRGLCALALLLIGTMSGLALLDRLVLMPDKFRWALSVVAYLGIAVILWRVCIRQLLGKESVRQTARLIEKARPDLREDLLSAVELDEADAGAETYDSPIFRHLLQEDVAGRVSEVKADELLPATLISRWIKGAAIAVAVFVALLFLPHFPQLFSRALLPGANLSRPSDILIVFIAPDPADRIVASGDTQPLEVKIEGGDIDRVTLETIEGDKKEKVYLQREAGNRFTGGIKVAGNDVRYRVRAENSLTRYHTLESRPRPAVSDFGKTYTPPSYSGLTAYSETHDHGDLSGLADTQVELVLNVNQKMAEAELQLRGERKDVEPLDIPLETRADGKLVASFPLDGRHTTYKVHLVAAESGFENTFSPLYEIRAVPDLIPKLVFTEPEDNQDVGASETITLRGSAEDDVALAEVFHAYRINSGSWTEISLATSPGKFWEFTSEWSLRLLPLKSGDIIVTKLVGIDTKGNRGESAPVRLAVSAEEDNSEKREWAEQEKNLAESLKELREKTEQAAHETHRAQEVLKKDPERRDLEDRQKLVKAEKATEEAKDKAEQVFEELKAALEEAPDRAEAEQLEAIAAAVADAKDTSMERLAEKMEDAAAGREEEERKDHHRPEHLAWDAAETVKRAEQAMKALAAEDMADIVAEDLENLAENQKDIAEDAAQTPSEERAPIAERQDIAGERAKAMEEELRELAEQLEDNSQKAAENTAKQIERQREKLDEAMEADNAADRLPDAARQMEERMEDAARHANRIAENAERHADEAMAQLEERVDAPSHEVEQLRWEAEGLAQKQDQLENEQNEARAEELSEQIEEAKEQFAERAEAVADQLASRAEAEEASTANNPQEAQDLSQAARALDEIAEAATEAETPEQAREVAQELAALRDAMEAAEAANKAEDIASALENIAESEGQEDASPTEAAELTEQVADDLRELPEEIGRALEQPQDAQRAAQQAANSPEARELGREMQERQRAESRNDDSHAEQDQSENVAALQEQVEAVQEQLEPAAEAAREQLAQMAPEAREMLRDLAEEMTEAAAASEALAEEAAAADQGSDAPPELGESASELAEAAEDANESIGDVSDALADEASMENISSPEGREAARDADDAIAQLREDAAPQAEAAQQALAEAAEATSPQEQAAALSEAAEAQAELSEQLAALADQLDAIAEGDAAEAEAARTALRESEAETGVAEPLGESYAQSEDISELLANSDQDPAATLAALEAELAENAAMKAALAEIAAEKAMAAAEKLAEAAAQESAMASAMEQGNAPAAGSPQSPAAQEQQSINSDVAEAAKELASAAAHQERLEEFDAAKSLEQSSQSAEDFAAENGEGPAAESQLASNPTPAANQPAVESAEGALQQSAQAAAEAAQKAAQTAAAKAAQAPPSSPQEQASAMGLAEALDQMSEMMSEQPGAPAQGSPAPSSNAAAAQAALAEAQAQQAAAMARSRAQGQTPGTQPSQSPSMAQNEGPASAQPGRGAQAVAKGFVLTANSAAEAEADAGSAWDKLPRRSPKTSWRRDAKTSPPSIGPRSRATTRPSPTAPAANKTMRFKTLASLAIAAAMACPPALAQEPKAYAAEDVQEACDKATKFLISQQWASGAIQKDGRRDRKHKDHQPPPKSIAMTSLAIMALAGVGHTPSDPTDEGRAMREALDFVLRPQHIDKHGYLGRTDGSRMYGHGIITLMLAEMVGMGADDDQDRRLRDTCQKAIDLIIESQRVRKDKSHQGGWRYEPDSRDSDLSATVWQLMALRAAKNGGLDVPKEVIDSAVGYVRRCYDTRKKGFKYQAGGGHFLFSTVAEGLLSMQVCGQYEAEEVIGAADFLLDKNPEDEHQWFYYGLYYYAQGMAQRGGEHASTAKQTTSRVLLKKQSKNGAWETRGGNEGEGGIIYATSMAMLSLSVHHNFLPIYQR